VKPLELSRQAVWAVLGLTACAYVLLLLPSLGAQAVNWREADVLIVGRNLCRGEGTLWLPRVSSVAEGPGITGMEFPLLNLAASGWACGGPAQVVVARALTVLLALVGVGAVGVLAARTLKPPGALVAIVAYAFSPLVFFYARTIQPDVPALSLALLALALLDLALPAQRPTRWWVYWLSAAVMAGGALVKLPVIVYGLPLLALLWSRRGWHAASDWRYWVYLPLSVAPPAVWYVHARRLQDRYGLHTFALGASWPELRSSWTTPRFYQQIFVQQLFDTYAYFLISAIAVLALVLLRRTAPLWLRAMAVAAVVFFFLAGSTAAWHLSYGLIAVPPIVFAAAFGVQALLEGAPDARGRAVLAALLLLVAGYGVWRGRAWFAAAGQPAPSADARAALDARLAPDQRILVLSSGDPKLLWYLDRKGPVAGPEFRSWLVPAERRPAAVVMDVQAIRGWAEGARETLSDAGYARLFRHAAVEIWLPAPP